MTVLTIPTSSLLWRTENPTIYLNRRSSGPSWRIKVSKYSPLAWAMGLIWTYWSRCQAVLRYRNTLIIIKNLPNKYFQQILNQTYFVSTNYQGLLVNSLSNLIMKEICGNITTTAEKTSAAAKKTTARTTAAPKIPTRISTITARTSARLTTTARTTARVTTHLGDASKLI